MAGPLLRTSGHEDHRHPTPLQQAIQPPHQDHTWDWHRNRNVR